MECTEFENNIKDGLQNIYKQYILFDEDELRHRLDNYRMSIMTDLEYQCFEIMKEHGIEPVQAEQLIKKYFDGLHDSAVQTEQHTQAGFSRELPEALRQCEKSAKSTAAAFEQRKSQQQPRQDPLDNMISFGVRVARNFLGDNTDNQSENYDVPEDGNFRSSQFNYSNPETIETLNKARETRANPSDLSYELGNLNDKIDRIRELSRDNIIFADIYDSFRMINIRSKTDIRTLNDKIARALDSLEKLPSKLNMFYSYSDNLMSLPQLYFHSTEQNISSRAGAAASVPEVQTPAVITPQEIPQDSQLSNSAYNYNELAEKIRSTPHNEPSCQESLKRQDVDSSREVLIKQLIASGVTPEEYRQAFERYQR